MKFGLTPTCLAENIRAIFSKASAKASHFFCFSYNRETPYNLEIPSFTVWAAVNTTYLPSKNLFRLQFDGLAI